jgi:hypothetical protein
MTTFSFWIKTHTLIFALAFACACTGDTDDNSDSLNTSTTGGESSADDSSLATESTGSTTENSDPCLQNRGAIVWDTTFDRGSDGELQTLNFYGVGAFDESLQRLYFGAQGSVGGPTMGKGATPFVAVDLMGRTIAWELFHEGPYGPAVDQPAGVAALTNHEIVVAMREYAGYKGESDSEYYQTWHARVSPQGEMQAESVFDRINDNPVGDGPRGTVVRATSDGGYVIVGVTDSSEPEAPVRRDKVYLQRYDAQSQMLWTKYYQIPDVAPDEYGGAFVPDAVVSPDNGIVVLVKHQVHPADQNIWTLTKFDSNGDFAWESEVHRGEQYPSLLAERLNIGMDGSMLIAGQTFMEVFGESKAWVRGWLARYDANGQRLWLREEGAPGSSIDNRVDNAGFNDAKIDAAGNVWAVGFYNGSTDWAKAWVRKYDPQGTELWNVPLHDDATWSVPHQVFIDSKCTGYVLGYTKAQLDESTKANQPFVVQLSP